MDLKLPNIDFSKLTKGLGEIRSFLPLVVFLLILIAAAMIYVPAYIMNSKLQKHIRSKSINMARELESLESTAVPKNQYVVEEQYQRSFAADANAIARLVSQTTQRELLSYQIFPNPKDTSMLIFQDFGRAYRAAVDRLFNTMNINDAPSEIEITQELGNPSATGSDYASFGEPFGQDRFSGGYSSRSGGNIESAIIGAMSLSRARSIAFYANPSALPGYDFWDNYEFVNTQTATEDCWFYQLAYWIIEDILKSIDHINRDANAMNVLDAPVKRLITVSFGADSGSYDYSSESYASSMTVGDDRPFYIQNPDQQLTTSFTERISNDHIDVVHFRVSFIMDTDHLFGLMESLCSAKEHRFKGYFGNQPAQTYLHNQITILQCNVEPLKRDNTNDDRNNYYRYGSGAIGLVEMVCEYFFNKDGYEPIKPESVKAQPDNVDDQTQSNYYQY